MGSSEDTVNKLVSIEVTSEEVRRLEISGYVTYSVRNNGEND